MADLGTRKTKTLAIFLFIQNKHTKRYISGLLCGWLAIVVVVTLIGGAGIVIFAIFLHQLISMND